MKKIFCILICLIITVFPCLAMSSCKAQNEDVITLYVYNWGEYISDGSEGSLDVNAAFEEWYYENYGSKNGTRVKVNYSTYSSNEDLYAKITSGTVNYDVIVPSDYMVQRLREEGYLAKLNYENIPNMENILPEFCGKNAFYDEGNVYSVPYLYGMIGIIYNTDMVLPDEENIGSWALMWDEDYAGNILQFNNSRDAFGTAQYYLGVDVNSATEEQWRDALKLLKEQKKIVQGYVMDEIFNKMENGSAAIAAYYAGDFLAMYYENDKLEFFYPKEGTNLYVDAMCIPKASKNKEIAERYIDFMLSEEAAIANAEYTYYASPNKLVVESQEYKDYMADIKDDAYQKMYPEKVKITDADKSNPDSGTVMYSSYENLTEDKLVLLNSLWEELKSDVEIGVTIYIICGVIIAGLLILFITGLIKKKNKQKLYDNP